ncbi:uncharacterized protein C11orf96-like [Pristis pectinata]|uniref:uncharacterized protein C11orf96-like n=1 Tax=Pristis pectinata TaxID=685728 RepID=UPI00223D7274|nr:uncharacterized protein C11orf96-like [Pristis pectinata]
MKDERSVEQRLAVRRLPWVVGALSVPLAGTSLGSASEPSSVFQPRAPQPPAGGREAAPGAGVDVRARGGRASPRPQNNHPPPPSDPTLGEAAAPGQRAPVENLLLRMVNLLHWGTSEELSNSFSRYPGWRNMNVSL